MAALEAVPVGVLIVDGEGKVAFLNRAAAQILGAGGDSLLGNQLGEVCPEQVERMEVNGKKVAVTVRPLEEGDQPSGAVVVLQDVTEYEALREAKEELEAIFDSSFDEIYVVDGDGFTRRVNKIGETYYGLDTAKIIGKHYSEMEREGYFNPSVSRLVFQERKRVTVMQRTKTGKILIVTGNPVFDEAGRITRIVVNSRDVSELINLKQRLEDTEQLVDKYRQLVMFLRQEKLESVEIIARSAQMKQLLDLVDRVAQVDSTVLITGESGVGKGVIAARIHKMSKRSGGPFVTINCGAIPENLLESELFGYEPGAFTGARREGKKGLIEMGSGGTVFLDEVTELPLSLQVKLLRVIQEKKLVRVGGTQEIPVNVRFIAATNRDIQKLVKEGLFREDLYYRLNVVPVTIPPLRYRREDIVPLVRHFVEHLNLKYDMNKQFSPEALEILERYHWPGNVRELENLVERLLVTTDAGVILPAHLPDYIVNSGKDAPGRVYVMGICPLKQAVEEVERQLIEMAVQKCRTTYEMAGLLQVNQSTVVRKIKKYRLKI